MFASNLDIIMAYVSGLMGESYPWPLPHLPFTNTWVSAARGIGSAERNTQLISFQLIKSLICSFVQPCEA